MEEIFTRRSVRSYTDQAISDEDIEQILRAGMAAPSAGNQQPWEFVVSTNAEVNGRLGAATPYSRPATHAPVVVVVCARTKGLRFAHCVHMDLGAATENMLLEAKHLGIGSVWMAVAPSPDRIKNVSECVDIPQGCEPFALVAFGYADKEPKPVDRFDPSRVHWVRA